MEVICKSVFKNDSTKAVKTEFTQKWAELISQFEKKT